MFLRIQLNVYILVILLMYLTVSTNMDKIFYVCYSEYVRDGDNYEGKSLLGIVVPH